MPGTIIGYVAELPFAGIQGTIQTRGEEGPFRSLSDFLHRTRLPSVAITNLIRVGGMDSLGERRDEMIRQCLLADRLKGRASGSEQMTLFSDSLPEARLAARRESAIERLDPLTQVRSELEILGIAVTAHPLSFYRPLLAGSVSSSGVNWGNT